MLMSLIWMIQTHWDGRSGDPIFNTSGLFMFDGLMVVLHVLCMFCCDIHIIKSVASCSQMVYVLNIV